MEKITSLAHDLEAKLRAEPHLTHLTLQPGEVFGWNHTDCAITYNPTLPNADQHLLHECGHALADHRIYTNDLQLVAMERQAWQRAAILGATYGIAIDNEVRETALDTYRNWLHARSLCPTCSATGVQIDLRQYRCLACASIWRVNEARMCALRRYHKK